MVKLLLGLYALIAPLAVPAFRNDRTLDILGSLNVITAAHNITQPSTTQAVCGDGSFYEDLLLCGFPEGQIPGTYEINVEAKAEWEREPLVMAFPFPELRHVTFYEFISATEAMFDTFDDQVSAELKCSISTWRKGSGVSANDTQKSYAWMERIFRAYLMYSEGKGTNEKLRACFGNSKPTPGHEPIRSERAIDPCPFDHKEDIVFILEDVSYSGTEFAQTVAEGWWGVSLSQRPEPMAQTCYDSFKKLIPMVAFMSTKAARLVDVALGAHILPETDTGEVTKTRTPWTLEIVAKFWRYGRKTIPIAKRRMFLPSYHVYPSDADGDASIYFDHKMADYASLGRNLVGAMGGASRPRYGLYDSKKLAQIRYFNKNPIPFIEGCEDIHRCASQNVGNGICSEGLQCPFPPYKSPDKLWRMFRECGCQRA